MTVARTTRVDADVDLAALAGDDGWLWERGRVGLAGRGVYARVPIADTAGALNALDIEDEVGRPGCGPVAFGALPFAPDRWDGATVVIPRRLAGRAEDGTRWQTVIGPPGEDEPPAPAEAPTRFTVAPARAPAWWCDLVTAATKAIADGPLHKVVLAREVVVTADVPIRAAAVVGRLLTTYPGC
jgi:menaquinone-specific isochorismate synthase